MKRTSAPVIKAFFISLAIAAWISGFVVAYAQSGEVANCNGFAKFRVAAGETRVLQRYTLTYTQEPDGADDRPKAFARRRRGTDYALAEGGRLFVGCGGGGASFAVVRCKMLKREPEKSDE